MNNARKEGQKEGRKEQGKNGWDEGKRDVKVKVGENLPEQGAVMRLGWDFYLADIVCMYV